MSHIFDVDKLILLVATIICESSCHMQDAGAAEAATIDFLLVRKPDLPIS